MICKISKVVFLLATVLFFERVRNNSLVKNIVILLRCTRLNKLLKIVPMLNMYSSVINTKQML